jgi:iron complex outermembrane receptor protein
LRLELLLSLPLSAVLALAQQQPQPSRESIVVTGTFEPLSLDEVDRTIRVLPARDGELVLNTLVDLLRNEPSLDLLQRAPDVVQADL